MLASQVGPMVSFRCSPIQSRVSFPRSALLSRPSVLSGLSRALSNSSVASDSESSELKLFFEVSLSSEFVFNGACFLFLAILSLSDGCDLIDGIVSLLLFVGAL